jgi:succinate dehydrogenase / fumarate reductase membrane anchor subunit
MTATTSPLTHRKVAVPSNWERRAFLFMRLSGALLLFLAVGHMMIQHVLNSSQNLTLQFVAMQWNSWGWKIYDMLLLFFAITHGFNGLRQVLEDYIHNRNTVKWINRALLVFTIITILWAGFAIASFDSTAIIEAAQNAN